MQHHLLSVKKVNQLLRRGEPGRHFDGQGLYLVIEHAGNASWSRRYQLHHAAHEIGIGSAFKFTSAEARERNRKIGQLLTDGIDPLTAKRQDLAAKAAATIKAKTFRECAEGDGTKDFEGYIKAHQAKWKSTAHGAQWVSSLKRYVYPKIGDIDVRDIDRTHVLSVLEQPVETTRGNPAGKFWNVRTVTANRVRNRIELILGWAAARGHRDSDKPNPARWENNLDSVLPAPTEVVTVKPHKAVPYAELPALMTKLHNAKGTAAKALRFLILTATRVSETLDATWDEFDLDNKIWTIPAPRHKSGKKTGKPHKVLLSSAALELLDSLPTEDGSKLLFLGPQSGKAMSASSLDNVLERQHRTESSHGMRATFKTWAEEQTNFSNSAIEISLAHVVGEKTERAYQRGELLDKRRRLMEAWGKYCSSGVAPSKTATDNVVGIGAGR